MKEAIIKLLYRALAEEFIAHYQYMVQKDILVGVERENIRNSFSEYADDELNDHAQKLIDRLTQLEQNLEPVQDYNNLATLTPNHIQILQSRNVADALRLNINSEEAAIETYTELVKLAQDEQDPVTEKIAKEILADEEEHLNSLRDYLDDLTALFKARRTAKKNWLLSHRKRL